MNKFLTWFNQNYTQIVWFLIGWLVQTAFVYASRGDYVNALFDLALAYFNYALYARRM
jgi:hypothetical protein